MIDHMERILPQNAFSPDGYIVDQAQCEGLRYGVWRSDRNGCGWIASYNFLKATGAERPVEEIKKALLRRSLLRGLLGTRMIVIYAFLRRCGYRPDVALGRKKILENAACAQAGILLYRHKDGWHYVCFLPEERGFRFLNAWTGPRDPVQTMDAFIRAGTKSRLLITLTVRDPLSPKNADG